MASSKLEQAEHFSRRTFLRAGSISAFGLSLPRLMGLPAAQAAGTGAATAKSCIMLYMIGGPPQHETFDIVPGRPLLPLFQ